MVEMGIMSSSMGFLYSYPSTSFDEEKEECDRKKRVRLEVENEVSLIVEKISISLIRKNAQVSRIENIRRILESFPEKKDWCKKNTKVKERKRKIKYSNWKCYTDVFLNCLVKLIECILLDENIRWEMMKYTISDDEMICSPGEKKGTPNSKRKIPIKMPKDKQCYVCRCRFVSSNIRKKHEMDPGFSKYLGIINCKNHGHRMVMCIGCSCLKWLNCSNFDTWGFKGNTLPFVKCYQKGCKENWNITDLEYMLVTKKNVESEMGSLKKIKSN